MHNAKCNIVIDTYFQKKLHDIQDMCKTIRHAFNECSFEYILCEHKVHNQYMKKMLNKAFDRK